LLKRKKRNWEVQHDKDKGPEGKEKGSRDWRTSGKKTKKVPKKKIFKKINKKKKKQGGEKRNHWS